MAKSREEKTKLLKEYKQKISDSKGIIIVKPKGVTANEAAEIKKELFDMQSEYHIVKNTLLKLALKESDLDSVESLEFGEHAIIYLSEDIASPAKVIKKYAKELKTQNGDAKLSMIAGFLDGNLLSSEQVQELADMPDKEGSISMILGILNQALSGVVNVLEDAPRSYVTIIDQAFKE